MIDVEEYKKYGEELGAINAPLLWTLARTEGEKVIFRSCLANTARQDSFFSEMTRAIFM